MKRKYGIGIILLIAIGLLFGCSGNGEQKSSDEDSGLVSEGQVEKEEAETKTGKEEEVEGVQGGHLSLPPKFPADFPLPDGMVITEVEDDSDDKRYAYDIRFDFNPELDTEALSAAYRAYAENLEYNIVMDEGSSFLEGAYQFGATSKFSANNMFIVTLNPESPMFGAIQYKESK